jgi:ankyrin repeat protein
LTPLHSACLIGLPKTAKILLQHGANPSQFTQPQENKNSGGRRFPHKATPIMLAARSGNTEIIRMLTAAKPNLSAEEAVMIGDTAALRKYLGIWHEPEPKG